MTKKKKSKRSLYVLFSHFGNMVDIVAFKTAKMRRQAFVIVKELGSSTNALTQGFPFYGKPVWIQYAKTDSDMISKMCGTFADKTKKKAKTGTDNNEHR